MDEHRKLESSSNMSVGGGGGYRSRMEESSRMSIEQSKERTSPNIDVNMNATDRGSQSMNRPRRSLSISSLDKLTNKLRNNLASGEGNRAESNESRKYGKVHQKRFIEESTKEVLVVARDGCYTYEQKGEN